MITYICACCGAITRDVNCEDIDSGTILICASCGKDTIVHLCTKADYTELFTKKEGRKE